MTRYRVSDGVESEVFEADSPDEALEKCFEGYDWGDSPQDLGPCEDATSRYTVWEVAEDGTETKRLSGPLSDVRPLDDPDGE